MSTEKNSPPYGGVPRKGRGGLNTAKTTPSVLAHVHPSKEGRGLVTRIAPSPTGEMHIGTLGMALCDYMVAKQSGGRFLLRIEDTDQKREVTGAADRLIAAFKKLGLEFDNADNIPYQSKRGALYQAAANKLIKEGKAYLDDGAVRFSAPENAPDVVWHDLIKGDMRLPALERDPVILKSNGLPASSMGVMPFSFKILSAAPRIISACSKIGEVLSLAAKL